MTFRNFNAAPGWSMMPRAGWLAALCIILLVGCGTSEQLETVPVSGTVLLDGKPLEKGTVIFSPRHGISAKGEILSGGSFRLGTYSDGDGAVAGMHRVAVIAMEGDSDSAEREPAALVPQRYMAVATSGIQFEVKADQVNEFQVKLTSK